MDARFVAVLLVVMAPLATSCGGEDGAMRVTLTDTGCTFHGGTSAREGRFSIELENRTLRFGSFGLVALFGDETIDDIDPFTERVSSRRLARSRARSDVPPPFGRWIVGAEVGPSASALLPVDTSAGRFVVLCFVHPNVDERLRADEASPPERAYAAAQLDVVAGTTASP